MEECKKVAHLLDDETAGRELTSHELEFVESHLATCDDCMFERAAFDSLSIDGEGGPVPFTEDDIARRRWIDETLAKAGERQSEKKTSNTKLWRPVAAAAAVAFIGATAAIIAISTSGDRANSTEKTGTLAIAQPEQSTEITGRVLLRAGKDLTEDGRIDLDTEISEGSILKVGKGVALVDLTTGVSLLLGEESRIKLRALNSDRIEIGVSKGEVLAMVDPEREGPSLSVSTRHGRIHVTGTVFNVSVNGKGTRVDVLRGKVNLDERGMPARNISVGESVRMGTAGVEAISSELETSAMTALKLLDILTAGDHATIKLNSLPDGAAVTLDSVVIGITPVSAAVEPGHRVAELSMEGRSPVRELLELGRGSEISRVFDLKQAPALADASPEDANEVTPLAVSAPKKSTIKLSASDLLAKAQRLRRARDWKGAARAYTDIIRSYPGSVEAHMSLVSRGAIQLDHLGNTGGALKSYDAYLSVAGSGTLAQEAAYGKLRALRKMNRTGDEKRAIQKFISAFPNALMAPAARARLEELQ